MAGVYTKNMSFDINAHYLSVTYHSLRLSNLLVSTAVECWFYSEEKIESYLTDTGTTRICKDDNTNIL